MNLDQIVQMRVHRAVQMHIPEVRRRFLSQTHDVLDVQISFSADLNISDLLGDVVSTIVQSLLHCQVEISLEDVQIFWRVRFHVRLEH